VTGLRHNTAWWVGLVLALGQLLVPAWAGLYDLELRSLHVALTTTLVLVAMPIARGRAFALLDLAMIGVALLANALVFWNWEAIVSMVGVAGPFEIALGALLSLIVLEAARRAAGPAIPIMVLLAFGYVFVGPLLPGLWSHPGFPVTYIIEQLYYSSGGLYGSLAGTSATFIAVFILFGALLQATGGGQAFMDLALIAAGRFPGGPAQVATVSSALFGTISGSAVANVAVNAPYTIPLMRRLGYDRNFAAGVEAMSSTGGGITPPIMGIAAFIMADILNVSYLDIVGYAVIPCLLFYVGLLAGVHFEAQRVGLLPVPAAEIPKARDVLTFWNLAPLLMPLGVMFWSLGDGENLTEAGAYACFTTIALFLMRDPRAWRARLRQLLDAFAAGGLAIAQIAPLLIAVSMFTALLGATGVAPKVSTVILELGAGNLIGALAVAAIVPLALGAPLPVAATYILSAALIAPALTRLGLDLIAVHMFLLYWATLAAVTPPTCTACVVAANVAEGNWFRTAMVGMRLGFVAFLMPFFFVLNPALIARAPWPEVIFATITGVLGTVLLAAGFFGFFRSVIGWPLRLLFIAAGICLLAPNLSLSLAGFALGALALVLERLARRRIA
jgi:TRAP transporter 4TM/12TM fusion protein